MYATFDTFFSCAIPRAPPFQQGSSSERCLYQMTGSALGCVASALNLWLKFNRHLPSLKSARRENDQLSRILALCRFRMNFYFGSYFHGRDVATTRYSIVN